MASHAVLIGNLGGVYKCHEVQNVKFDLIFSNVPVCIFEVLDHDLDYHIDELRDAIEGRLPNYELVHSCSVIIFTGQLVVNCSPVALRS